jgi:hypothetical protein
MLAELAELAADADQLGRRCWPPMLISWPPMLAELAADAGRAGRRC